MLTIVDPFYFLTTIIIAAAMAYFHYHDHNVESKKQSTKSITPAKLDKSFVTDFNSVEAKARVSHTEVEKAEVEKLIEVFKEQHKQYPETRYNAQILQCINRMRNKEELKYNFEFQN